jgi:hypothetical protein
MIQDTAFEEVVNYKYCTGVPFREGMEYCFTELSIRQLDTMLTVISIVIVSLFILAIAVWRKV